MGKGKLFFGLIKSILKDPIKISSKALMIGVCGKCEEINIIPFWSIEGVKETMKLGIECEKCKGSVQEVFVMKKYGLSDTEENEIEQSLNGAVVQGKITNYRYTIGSNN